MSNLKSNRNISASHVMFGSNISIDTTKKLPQFDNGNSKAYLALDHNNQKFIAIVAGIDSLPRWDSIGAYKSLADTSFMLLVGSGVVRWPLDGTQKYVFMYSYCAGDSLLKGGTVWRHPDIIEYFVRPMARMFKVMVDKNFNHGSLRADNIYYSASDGSSSVILGDGLSVFNGSTQPPLYLPPSKALAEPMGRGGGSVKDDIYAFGVSLIMILRKGNSDFYDAISDEEMLSRKMEIGSYAALIGAERFQLSFLELLKGVLHDDSDLRWGVDEIFAWADGSILTPAPLTKKKKASRAISFNGNRYFYANFLAMDLYKDINEAVDLVNSGALEQWVLKSVDDSFLSERYVKIIGSSVDGTGSDKELIVSQLGIVLDPTLPIRYKGRCFTHDGLGAMMAISVHRDEDLAFYRDVINLNLLDQSLSESGDPHVVIGDRLKLYDTCRASLKRGKVGYGIERCVYLLCKSAPCFSPKVKGYFISECRAALAAFEDICNKDKGGQISLIMDSHLIAFFFVHYHNLIDGCLYDLGSSSKDRQIFGNLCFAAAMQKRSKIESVPALAAVFLDSMSGVYKIFKNKKTRKNIEEGVRKAAQAGDLVEVVALLDNEALLSRDDKWFRIASAEYNMLNDEYDQYNRSLANNKTYGVTNGRNTAAVVSWIGATIITVIVVLAFLSGNLFF